MTTSSRRPLPKGTARWRRSHFHQRISPTDISECTRVSNLLSVQARGYTWSDMLGCSGPSEIVGLIRSGVHLLARSLVTVITTIRTIHLSPTVGTCRVGRFLLHKTSSSLTFATPSCRRQPATLGPWKTRVITIQQRQVGDKIIGPHRPILQKIPPPITPKQP